MSPSAAATANSHESLLERRLLLFIGKGGVGKSTLAAATARLRAARGERVLLCEVNASGHLARLLGLSARAASPSTDGELRRVSDTLSLCNLVPDAALHEYAVMKLKMERVVDRLLDNRLVHHFLRLLPGLPEIVTLGKLLYHVKEQASGRPRFDAVILDAPATGHGLSLLRIPKTLLATVPKGPLRDDMTWMNAILVDPSITAANLVTLCEELPVNETLELNAALRDDLAVPRGVCLANAVWPDRFSAEDVQQIHDKASAAAAEVADRFFVEASVNRTHLARLRDEIQLPVLALPVIFDAPDGAQLTATIERLLAAALGLAPPKEPRP